RPGSGPVRDLALVEDGPGRAQSHLVCEPRGGRAARAGTRVVPGRGAEAVLHPTPGDPRGGPADRLPLLPRRAAGRLVARARDRPVAERDPLQLPQVVRPEAPPTLHRGVTSAATLQ